jgi:N-acylglucosamine 2-epimerase
MKNQDLPARIHHWQDRFHRELFSQVIPFWQTHSPDREYGGYFNCLDRDGQRFDTKKYVWLQGRQAWMFAKLYNEWEPRSEWLEMAHLGVEFLRHYAHRPDHRVYFCLTRDGKPLQLQRKIFSECFYVMALAEYARATHDQALQREARDVFTAILGWSKDLSQVGRPHFAGSAATSELAIPMILLNLIGELKGGSSPDWQAETRWCLDQITLHVHPDLSLVLETVAADGSLLESPEGRLVNPGHAIEAGWFLLDYAEQHQDPTVTQQALDMIRWSLDFGWDPTYGGLFYFLDRAGYSPLQLEWSLKLWWPHCEAMVATLWAFCVTQDPEWLQRFDQVAEYTFAHFADPEGGEWFGYLDRQGQISQRFKGGPYKGCFHVPRALFLGLKLLDRARRSRSREHTRCEI